MMWIAVDANLYENNKVKAVRNGLKLNSIEEAMGYMVKFWGWCLKNADRTGLLAYCNDQDIADAFGWKGKTSSLISTLTAIQKDGKAGLLERTPDGEYIVHDWDELQKAWYKYQDALEADRKRKREKPKEYPLEIPPEKQAENAQEKTSETRQYTREELGREIQSEILDHNLNRNHNTLDEEEDSARASQPASSEETEDVERLFQADADDEPREEIGEPSERKILRLKKQWKDSFGDRPTPEQLNYLTREAWFTPEELIKEAIIEAAYRGVATNRPVYISKILATYRLHKISNSDDLAAWRAGQDLEEMGLKKPAATPIIPLDDKEPRK